MRIALKYGQAVRDLEISDRHVLAVLTPREIAPLADIREAVLASLRTPDYGKSLGDILTHAVGASGDIVGASGDAAGASGDNGLRILVIVSDITRCIPQYPSILEVLVDEITASCPQADINFLIANGTHRSMTDEEIRAIYGERLADKYCFHNHDCDSPDLVNLGTMSGGTPLLVNPLVPDTDVVIVTGRVAPHYFAGFSGGRKSILPGVSGRSTIRANHSRVNHDGVQLGSLRGNPINEEMVEAALLAGVDFSLMITLSLEKKATAVFSGDMLDTHEKACSYCLDACGVVPRERSDCVIVSAGGFPQDISLFQMQRSLQNTRALLKPGGTFLLVGEASEGIGQDTFDTWLTEAESPCDLVNTTRDKILVGGHTAVLAGKLLSEHTICMVSSLPHDILNNIFYRAFNTLGEAVEFVRNKHGSDFSAYVVPDGAFLLAHEGDPAGNDDVDKHDDVKKRNGGKRGFWKKRQNHRSRRKRKFSKISYIVWGLLLGMLTGYLIMWSNGSSGGVVLTFWTSLVHDIVTMVGDLVTFILTRLAIILGGTAGAVAGYYLYRWRYEKPDR